MTQGFGKTLKRVGLFASTMILGLGLAACQLGDLEGMEEEWNVPGSEGFEGMEELENPLTNLGSCTYTAATKLMELELEGSEVAVISKGSTGSVLVNGYECTTGSDTASVTNTYQIAVTESGGSNTLILDYLNGIFVQGRAGKVGVVATLNSGDAVKIRGTSGVDRITLGDEGISTNTDVRVDITVGTADTIVISTGSGNDVVSGAGTLYGTGSSAFATALTIYGGIGNDTLTGGSAADTIYGGEGNDKIAGGAAADTLWGGAGNDTFEESTAATGGDAFWGGDGSDTVDYGDRTAAITATIGSGANDGDSESDDIKSDVEVVIGGNQGDTLTCGDKAKAAIDCDAATGLNSANFDTIIEFSSIGDDGNLWTLQTVNDTALSIDVDTDEKTVVINYIGGTSTVTLVEAAINALAGADDVIEIRTTGTGTNTLHATNDAKGPVNLIGGDDGDCTLNGGDGNDALNGGDGDDTLNGGNGNDTLTGKLGDDTLNGNAGNDTFDEEDGGVAADIDCVADLGSTNLDTVIALVAKGEDGNNWTLATVDGGASSLDVAVDTTAKTVVITFDADTDTVATVEAAIDLETVIEVKTAGTATNTLVSADVESAANFSGGDDDTGSDTMFGSTGTDTVDYGDRTAENVVTMADNQGNDGVKTPSEGDNVRSDIENIIGGAGVDTITGNNLANEITGGLGDDILDGGSGNDTFHEGADTSGADTFTGGAGTDLVDYSSRGDGSDEHLVVTMGDDTANDGEDSAGDGTAEEGDDVGSDIENIDCGTDDDTVTGNALANVIYGNTGDDTLNGGAGDDTIDGGAGTDTINCGDGDGDIGFNGTTSNCEL